ncbi:hypothetical protein H8D51_03285 [bacterium]|nr:hypothetical protein [bacterium]
MLMKHNSSIVLEHGNWPVEFHFCNRSIPFRDTLLNVYPQFVTKSSPQARLDIIIDEKGVKRSDNQVIVHTDGKSYELSRYNCKLTYDVESGYGRLLFGFFVGEFQLSLWNALMEVLIGMSHILSETGVLVHAAGMETRTGGWLIPGKSGAGKSTLVTSFPSSSVINDEKILVRIDGKAVLASDVPLQVPYRGQAHRTALKGIMFLDRLEEQDVWSENTVDLDAVQTTRNLLMHVLPPNYYIPEKEKGIWLKKVLVVCARIASLVPGCSLSWKENLLSRAESFLIRKKNVIR